MYKKQILEPMFSTIFKYLSEIQLELFIFKKAFVTE